MKRSGEFDWISRYLAPLASATSFALKDDAALLSLPDGKPICVTQDAIVETIHFLPNDPPKTVAQKALRVNVSDCIAKGAKPFAYSLALGVPDRWQDEDMAHFAEGLRLDQQAYDLELTGGDTYRSPDHLNVSVTMFAALESADAYCSRLDANVGDLVCVTGTLGDSALGLLVSTGNVETDHQDYFTERYRVPQPPFGFERICHNVKAAMDISDGLLGDARKMAEASDVSMTISRDQIPLSDQVKRTLTHNSELWETVVTGGDDYQTLFTIAQENVEEIQNHARSLGIQVTVVGEITKKSSKPVSLTVDGVPVSFEQDSYSHF